ncbi:MAG: 30S ribosomal protein S20 [Proteobacteria bacterium]|nr:30S ribosomal protein S20 [Pseudomonadota bacterium]
MANHKSALKRHHQSLENRERNRSTRSRMKTAVKAAIEAVETKDANAAAALSSAVSVVAKSASKGLIHKNTAARKISRLTKRVNAALQSKA